MSVQFDCKCSGKIVNIIYDNNGRRLHYQEIQDSPSCAFYREGKALCAITRKLEQEK